jgi:hypothetical protein
MDEGRIRKLSEEVLAQIRGGASPDLEARVSALEAAVASLQRGAHPAAPAPTLTVSEVRLHPTLQLLGVDSGAHEGRCCLEPDKPCLQSGQCRRLGH